MKKNYHHFHHHTKLSKILYLLAWPIAIISLLLPKKKITLFSSMNGFQIADNAKYLYDNYYDAKLWITKNKSIVKPDNNILYAYSLKGIYYQLVAHQVYFTHGIYDFIPYLIWGAKKINLWHGVPLKEIGPAADNKGLNKLSVLIKKWYYKIFPYTYYMACDVVFCPHKNRVSDYKRYFLVSAPEIWLKKQPRNVFAPKWETEKKVLFCPTFRASGQFTPISLMAKLGCFERLEKLTELGYKIVLRPHPIDLEKTQKDFIQQDIRGIELDLSTDIYQTITSYQYIITDYSSLLYDCIELNIPCYIFTPDIEQYKVDVGLCNLFFDEVSKRRIEHIDDIV